MVKPMIDKILMTYGLIQQGNITDSGIGKSIILETSRDWIRVSGSSDSTFISKASFEVSSRTLPGALDAPKSTSNSYKKAQAKMK